MEGTVTVSKPKAKLRLYSPHPGQKTLHASKARFRIVTCGRRWGKTMFAANCLVGNAWREPDEYIWVAPTYRLSEVGLRMVLRFNGAFKRINESKMQAYMINGARIDFRSGDNPETLVGIGYKGAVLDECALLKRSVWEESIRASLTDKKGWAILIAKPRGRNWFYHEYCRGQDSAFPDYQSFKFPTASNPYIDSAEVEAARNTLPSDVFRQEYEAEFLENNAGVFRRVRECIGGVFTEPQAGRQYVGGWDIAKHEDFSVIVIMDTGTGHIVHFDRFNQIDYRLQLQRVELVAKKYNADMLIDSTGVGDPILEGLKTRGARCEGYHFTNTSKQQLVEHLAVQIEQRQVSFPEIPELINELELYQYEMTHAGNVRYNAPEGFYDDCVVALGLAAWQRAHKIHPAIVWL